MSQEPNGTWPQEDPPSATSAFDDPGETSGLKRRSTAMTLSRSHEGFQRTGEPGADEDTSTDGHDEPLSPPLLMPPPTSGRLSRLRRSAGFAIQSLDTVTGTNLVTIGYFTRLGIFLAKVASLMKPCWPYVPGLEVAVPLIAIAALDLRPTPGYNREYSGRRPSAWTLGTSVTLMVLHVWVLWCARRWGMLCVNLRQDKWQDW